MVSKSQKMLKCPSTQPPIHPPINGVTPQVKNLQRELNYLDKVAIYLIFRDLTLLQLQNSNLQTELNYLDSFKTY